MMKMKKFLALALIIVSVVAIAAPALAVPTKCPSSNCGAALSMSKTGTDYEVQLKNKTVGNKVYFVFEIRTPWQTRCIKNHGNDGYDVKGTKEVFAYYI